MAGAMIPYIVKKGDHLDKLAFAKGFDANTVWNDPKNADLKKLRQPNMLCTGDVLYIPSTPPPGLPFSQRTNNRFQATVPTTEFHMTCSDTNGTLANAAYSYTIEGQVQQGTTDGNGKLSIQLPITSTDVKITFTASGHTTIAQVGHLDPPSELTGAYQRLKHQGFIVGMPSGNDAKDAKRLARGIAAFQRSQKLPVTSKLDDATVAKLTAVCGS